MNLTLNDFTKTAYIQDFDQTEWDAQYSTIPWDYKIEFNPSVDDAILNGLNTGRELLYDQRTIYVQEWIGNTMIVRPQIIFVQQLLPLHSDPSVPAVT